eukprot:scaffold31760_cov118-Isochrysis_galbana.AAC.1
MVGRHGHRQACRQPQHRREQDDCSRHDELRPSSFPEASSPRGESGSRDRSLVVLPTCGRVRDLSH